MTYILRKYEEHPDGFQTRVIPREVYRHKRISGCEAWLTDNYNLVEFERDPDGHDAADAFATSKTSTREAWTFTIEKETGQ